MRESPAGHADGRGVRLEADGARKRVYLVAGPVQEIRLLEECCTGCLAMLKKRVWDARLDAWKKLPRIMGVRVDGWAADAR